jgi:hypothetical protein
MITDYNPFVWVFAFGISGFAMILLVAVLKVGNLLGYFGPKQAYVVDGEDLTESKKE